MHLSFIFSSRLSRLLAILVFFGCILFVLDRAGSLILKKIVQRSSFRYSKLYANELKDDAIVILGSSRSVVAFYQPEMEKRLDMQVINAGYNGLNPAVQEVLLADIINAGVKPKMIIFELSNVNQRTDLEWVSVLEPFQVFSNGLWDVYRNTKPQEALKCEISHLFCLNNELLLRVFYYLLKDDQDWTQTRQISSAEIAAIPTAKAGHILDEKNILYYQRMLELTRNQAIPVRLVLAPYFPKMAKQMHIDDFLCKLESKLSHPIDNYINAVTDPTGYADSIHLNKRGALQFLNRLIQDGYFSDFKLHYQTIDRSQCMKNRSLI